MSYKTKKSYEYEDKGKAKNRLGVRSDKGMDQISCAGALQM
jgi:hypothetical protein